QGGKCDWCGVELTEDMGYRLYWPEKSLGTAFCRLEHIVPFLMEKDQWHIWKNVHVPEGAPSTSSATGGDLGDNALYLVHHRDQHRIADAFQGKDDLLEWAQAGGHFAPKSR
ncbi:MAG: hypothetical protein ACK5LN_11600, partial [Propioniciclava sp.]